MDSIRRLHAGDRMQGLRAGLARSRSPRVREHFQTRESARNPEPARDQRYAAGMGRSAAGRSRVSSWIDGAYGEVEHRRADPAGAYDDLLPRWLNPENSFPAPLRRALPDQKWRAERQPRDAYPGAPRPGPPSP